MTNDSTIDRRSYVDRRCNPDRRQQIRLERWDFDRRSGTDRRKDTSQQWPQDGNFQKKNQPS